MTCPGAPFPGAGGFPPPYRPGRGRDGSAQIPGTDLWTNSLKETSQ